MTNIAFTQNVDDKFTFIDSLLTDYDGSKPGASVMVIKNGDVLFKKAYGLADIETDMPVTTETNFRLASVTKQFTAACILNLINENKLSFNYTLNDLYPEFPDYGKNITIEHLLTHTSGLIDYEDLIPDTATIQVYDNDVLSMMMTQDSTYFEPGSQYRYSNTAYALLKMIIEKISGLSFNDYLNQIIFNPFGMNRTVAHTEGSTIVENRAYGSSRTDSGFVKTDQSLTSAVLGDGGIYSSVEDMFKWDQALYTDKILPLDLLNKAFTRKQLSSGELIDYGYGWRLKKFLEREVVYHTGSTIGGRTIIYRIPSEKLSVIFLSNRNEGDTLLIAEEIITRIIQQKQ